MKKIAIAVDSFKGSLSSMAAGKAIAEGARRVWPSVVCEVRPLADGGEGTVDALADGLGGERREATVQGPLGVPVQARYALLPGGTAVMEMAAASGITLVPREKRNPLVAGTFGVGEMIEDAVKAGCRRFIVGIGGSATNDGGAGMLQALGFALEDSEGKPLGRGGAALAKLARIGAEGALPELKECSFRVACDVTNPLCGELGASATFGPQKGASPEMVRELDEALAHFAAMAGDDATQPGDGAAGGLGFAFRKFLGAEMARGVDLILSETKLEEAIRDADLVVTGEGRLDAQTAMGKAPIGVARLAKRFGKKTVAFSGCVAPDARLLNQEGIDAFFPALRTVCTLEEALDPANAAANLADAAEQAFRMAAIMV